MGRPLRVLLIEDSDDDAMLVLLELRRGGFEPSHERVDTAAGMMAALDSSEWDLVICDYLMPRFSGVQALELFTQKELEIPFIIVSGKVGEELAVQAMRLGAHDYVMKQNLKRLVPAVERELGDAEERRQRHQAEEKNKRLLMAIGQCAELIIITDVEGTIQYVNPAFEKVTGYSETEVLGRNPRLLQSGEQHAEFYRKMWDVLLSGEIWRGRFINRKKDGTLYTEEATISPAKDSAGRLLNYVAVKRDITEKNKLEAQLRQSQKMESIGQLVGGVAHDFNNLLHVINGQAEMALAQIVEHQSPIESLDQIVNAGERAQNLVRQLLAFSRQQVVQPIHLDLNKEINSAKEMLARLIGVNIEFTFIEGKGLGFVFIDPGQVHQVLMNLCVNAHDAMPNGGKLTLETEGVSIKSEDLENQIGDRPGRYILLTVSDTGCGMNKTISDQIFDPFFTTKELGKGTGLGLSTVYGIVKQNNGYISVSSEPNEGASFKIYLPMREIGPAELTDKLERRSAAVKGGGETVLVVEDEEMILGLATCVLNNAGYTTLSAHDGLEAVQVFEEHADEIDVVLMDVMMPRMGGNEAMGKILEKCPEQRYLFASGYSPDKQRVEDAKHQLAKPYLAGELLLKIREVLEM
jgi:PAS domain S-box-containing protein